MLGTTVNALGLADAFKKEGVPCVISTPFDLNGLIPKLTDEEVLEKYNGGGHMFASGVRLKDMGDVDKLIDALDEVCKNYKEESYTKSS